MDRDSILIRLFKEPESLTRNEVRRIAIQLKAWSDKLPAVGANVAPVGYIGGLVDSMGGA